MSSDGLLSVAECIEQTKLICDFDFGEYRESTVYLSGFPETLLATNIRLVSEVTGKRRAGSAKHMGFAVRRRWAGL